MADPRFFDNRGPFTLAEVCAAISVPVPEGADGTAAIHDVASLTGAVAAHLTFFTAEKTSADFAQTSAGFCLYPIKAKGRIETFPANTVLIKVPSVQHAFAAVCELFYPDCHRLAGPFNAGIDPTAKIGANVVIAPSVVIGPGAEIGDGTRLGPNTVIGRGVCVGRDCDIAGNSVVVYAYLGDQVQLLAGAQIGQSGFGFASGAQGHAKIPQLGRVILHDRVEIGACSTVDRGALGDTVVGEGTKIDNLVQIGHNSQLGRHCVMCGQSGLSGSAHLGDFVIIGGQSGVSDHAKVGTNTRLAGRTGLISGQEIEGGRDYGGVPAKPVKEWIREIYAVNQLVKKPKGSGHD